MSALAAAVPAPLVSRRVRAGTMTAVFLVAGVALVASYSHMYDLAYAVGERWRSPLFPLAVDGLVLAAGLVIWARSRQRRPAGFLARFSLALGLVVSVAANVAATDLHTVASWAPVRGIVVGWAPVAAFLAVHLLFQLARDAGVVPALPDVLQRAAEAPGPVSLESPKLPTALEPELEREAVPATPVAPSVPAQRKPSRREARRQGREETMAAILQALTELPPGASLEAIGVKAGVSARTAGRYLEEAAKAGRLKAELLEPEPAPAAVTVPDDASTLLPLPDPDPTTGGRVPALSAT